MALNADSVWLSTLSALPIVSNSSWVSNFANWIDGELTSLLELSTISSDTFTFDKAQFETELANLPISSNKSQASQNVADAFMGAITVSSMSVTGGSGFGYTSIIATGTVNNESSVNSTMKSNIESVPNVTDVNDTVFHTAVRSAILTLIYQVSGTGVIGSPPPVAFSQTDSVI